MGHQVPLPQTRAHTDASTAHLPFWQVRQLEAQEKEARKKAEEAQKWQSVPGLMPVMQREEVS